jgi:hypothetical protein
MSHGLFFYPEGESDIPPKRQFMFNTLHGVTYQNLELFVHRQADRDFRSIKLTPYINQIIICQNIVLQGFWEHDNELLAVHKTRDFLTV